MIESANAESGNLESSEMKLCELNVHVQVPAPGKAGNRWILFTDAETPEQATRRAAKLEERARRGAEMFNGWN